GWFHTGDVGHIEPGGHLRITGRKKEIFKTSLGKYISPELIENKFKESSFIDTLMVIGENQKFAAALVVPDFPHLRAWCAIKEIPYTSDAEMVAMPRIKKRFQQELDKFNKFFGTTEQVKRFEMIDHEWTVDTGELTASLKLRRRFINEKYDTIIRKIFDLDDNN
ncbi:MAG: long-chain fatty acid--CoA ligase, partial [Bacteroidetes bacterium HGW-Bacteroidetes-6]